jgi:hypothetical protein
MQDALPCVMQTKMASYGIYMPLGQMLQVFSGSYQHAVLRNTAFEGRKHYMHGYWPTFWLHARHSLW